MRKCIVFAFLFITVFSLSARDCRMLIVLRNDYEYVSRDFINWKNKLGYKVDTLILNEETASNYYLVENAIHERIAEFDTIPEYLLFIGHDDVIRLSPWDSFASDMYYADIDSDSLADMIVARIPVEHNVLMTHYTNKIFHYEKEPWVEDDSLWFLRGTLATSTNHLDSLMDPYWECLFHADSLMLLHDFTHIDTFFTPYEEVHSEWITDAFAEGRGYIMFRGEGVEGWAGYNSFWPSIDLVPSSKNPVVSGFTCGTLQFYGPAWINSGNWDSYSGAVAYAGMATSFNDSRLTDLRNAGAFGFSEGIFNGLDLGHAIQMGRERMLEIPYDINIREYNSAQLLGDPTLKIWKKIPQFFEIEHEDNFDYGETNISLTVNGPDGAVENALVCVMHGEAVYEYAYTSETGEIEFDFYADSTIIGDIDTIYITVSKADFIPYEGGMTPVVTGIRPHVSSVVMDDTETGNGDNSLFRGEISYVDVNIRNIGTIDAENVDVWMESSLEFVTLDTRVFSIEHISSHDSLSIDDYFSIAISEDAAISSPIEYSVCISWDSDTFCYDFACGSVLGADFVLSYLEQHDYRPGGDNDGVSESGEVIRTKVGFMNNGNYPAQDISVLFNENEYLFSFDSLYSIDREIVIFDTLICPEIEIYTSSITDGFIIIPFNFDISYSNSGYGEYNQRITYNTEFQSQIERTSGPDFYGYYLYDHTDISTGLAPEYNWVELADEIGTIHTEFIDDTQDYVTASLPFTFRYYGEDYDNITIFSKGYILPGISDDVNIHPVTLPSAEAPASLIAPAWGNHTCGSIGNIYTWFDESNHRFVVEYKNLQGYFMDSLTVQVVLEDPEYSDSPTTDSDIFFYYKDFRYDFNKGIGFQNSTAVTGLSYMMSGSYTHGGNDVDSVTALRITTTPPPHFELPWIIADEAVFSDSEYGDGNGIFTEGERITCSFNLRNIGDYAGTNMNLELDLFEICSHSELNDSVIVISSIDPGESIETGTFSFTLEDFSMAPSEYYLKPVLRITNDDGYNAVLPFYLPLSMENVNEILPDNIELARAFPNPFNSNINIELNIRDEYAELEIYDVYGHIVHKKNFAKQNGYVSYTWRPESLNSGIYFIRVNSKSGTTINKPIVLIK